MKSDRCSVPFGPKQKAFNEMIGQAYKRGGDFCEEASLQHRKGDDAYGHFLKIEDSKKSYQVTEFKTSMVRQRKVCFLLIL